MSVILNQNTENRHRHLWLLSGTGEGPSLARKLLELGWEVSVSVVTKGAASQYSDLPLKNIWIGPLQGVSAITSTLEEAALTDCGFDYVIDATHPFAVLISNDLKKACNVFGQPLLRFERPIDEFPEESLISDLEDLSRLDLKGKKILFAIGSRCLPLGVELARKSGAEVYARVLPTPESLRIALSSCLEDSHLAVLRPKESNPLGAIEAGLLSRWLIDGVVCRQSGGYTQKIWQNVCNDLGLKLWMLARPPLDNNIDIVYSIKELVVTLSSFKSFE